MDPTPHLDAHDPLPFESILVPLLSPPALILLFMLSRDLWERIDIHHPEAALACALAILTSLLLTWNALSFICAHIALASSLPRLLTQACATVVRLIGTRSARRFLTRSAATSALGVGLLTPTLTPALAHTPPPALPHSITISAHNGDDLMWSPPPPTESEIPAPHGLPAEKEQTFAATPHVVEETAPPREHIVSEGECLWSITRDLLGPDADEQHIAASWPRLYESNVATIGSDPDLILPGHVLIIPEELK